MLSSIVYRDSLHLQPGFPLPFYPYALTHFIFEKGEVDIRRKLESTFAGVRWMVSGELEVTIDNVKHTLYENDVYLMYPHEQRSAVALTDDCEFYGIEFDGPLAGAVLMAYGYGRVIRAPRKCPVQIFQDIASKIGDASSLSIRLLLSEYLRILALLGSEANEQTHSRKYVDRCKEIIQTRYSDPMLCIDTICEIIGCNRQTLTRAFKAETGKNIKNVIIATRLASATTLLRNSDYSIQEVGVRCGIPTLTTFCRFIRKWTGFSPKALRQQTDLELHSQSFLDKCKIQMFEDEMKEFFQGSGKAANPEKDDLT